MFRQTSLGVLLTLVWGCQEYPFETRAKKCQQAIKINEVVTTVLPTDILFVLDNSGSMDEELGALQDNLVAFIDKLTQSANDYRVGFITTDTECNLPENSPANCMPNSDPIAPGPSAECCRGRLRPLLPLKSCLITGSFPVTPCTDDTVLGATNCDGGRLRGNTDDLGRRVFDRPAEADLDTWKADVRKTICELQSEVGTGYEAGLEAARRAVVCSLSAVERDAAAAFSHDGKALECPDPAVGALNAAFLRKEAALVIIFVTDEDDCSFFDSEPYRYFDVLATPAKQATHLCTPAECYAYNAPDYPNPPMATPLIEWADRPLNDPRLNCIGQSRFACADFTETRTENPPLPDPVSDFLDDIIAAKGGDAGRVRAGAIMGGISGGAAVAPSLFMDRPCFDRQSVTDPGPSDQCGCWSSGGCVYCDITAEIGVFGLGLTGAEADPCQAMNGGRYLEFLSDLAARQIVATGDSKTVVDTICQADYTGALEGIADTVFFDNCFVLGVANVDEAELQVRLNGELLEKVSPGSPKGGWSQNKGGSTEICLEGNLEKKLDDELEIFMLTVNQCVE